MSAPEFSRPVTLARIGAEPFRRDIAADEAERAALARRFDLVGLGRLEAAVELRREPRGTILLTASYRAEFVQDCVVTLEPVPGTLAESFALRYGPPEAETGEPGDDDPAFEPLDGEAIDLGEAVAQEFSLALPQFPRAPGVELDPADLRERESPFAFLAGLARPPRPR